MVTVTGEIEQIAAGGCQVEVRRRGSGETIVYLHGSDGLLFADPFVDALGEHGEVVAPVLPGWTEHGRAGHVTTVDDLSYVLLDLLDALSPDHPVPVVASCFGAWVAAEAATKQPSRFSGLVLSGPIGIKTGGRRDRAFVDVYATAADVVRASLYGDPRRVPDLAGLSSDEFRVLAQSQEAVARFGWEPYLHNPKLRHRLSRLSMPVLVVTGTEDRFVLETDYGRSWVEAIGDNARAASIAGAGHRVEEEFPSELAAMVADFVLPTPPPADTKGD